jgi:hypothetical protein
MAINRLIGAVVSFTLVAGCNPEHVSVPSSGSAISVAESMTFKFADNPHAAERVRLTGFSVVPPQGEHWIEGPRFPDPDPERYDPQPQIQFVKILPQPKSGPHGIIARALIAFIPEEQRSTISGNVREHMQYQMRLTLEQDRISGGKKIRIKSQKADLDESLGYSCFRYDAVSEDNIGGSKGTTFTSDFHAYQCIDPSLKFIVGMEYIQRRPSNVKPVDIATEAEGFLKSLKFEPPVS